MGTICTSNCTIDNQTYNDACISVAIGYYKPSDRLQCMGNKMIRVLYSDNACTQEIFGFDQNGVSIRTLYLDVTALNSLCSVVTPPSSCTAPSSCGTYPNCSVPDCAGVCGGGAYDWN